MLSIVEVIRWTNTTIFELWLHCVGVLIFSILLTAKLELYSGISYWYVFTPLFVASAFNCYFLFIVFVRTIVDEKDCKAPFLKYAFSWLRLVMLGVFEALLCYKINGDLEDGQVAVQSSYGVIFLPIWVLMAALCFQEWNSFDLGGSSLNLTINILYGAIFFFVVLVFLKIALEIGTAAHTHRKKHRKAEKRISERKRRMKSDSKGMKSNLEVSRCSSKCKHSQRVPDETAKRLEAFDPSTVTLDLQREKFIEFPSWSPHHTTSLTSNVDDLFLRSLLQLPPRTFLEERDDWRTKQSSTRSLGKTSTSKEYVDQSDDRKQALSKTENFLQQYER